MPPEKPEQAPDDNLNHYFVGPWVDSFFVGGFSLLTLPCLLIFLGDTQPTWIFSLSAFLLWIGNWPHFSATSYRLYHSKENIKQYPLTATLVPIFVILAAGLSIRFPSFVAPYFIKLFLIWSPYHFSGQTIGITLIYLRRCGITLDKYTRLALSGFVYGTFLRGTIATEVSFKGASYYGIAYPGFGLPAWLVPVSEILLWLSASYFLVSVFSPQQDSRRRLKLIVFIPAIAQFFWFVGGASIPSYIIFVPFFHGIQYLLIAWSMQLGEKSGLQNQPVTKQFLLMESARWTTLNFIGGALLFFVLPKVCTSIGVPSNVSLGVITAAVQIHHFFVDGVIWKLRRKTVSQPLMMNVGKLFKSTELTSHG